MGPFSEQLQLQWIKRNNGYFWMMLDIPSQYVHYSVKFSCYFVRAGDHCCVLCDVTRDLLFLWYIVHQPYLYCHDVASRSFLARNYK